MLRPFVYAIHPQKSHTVENLTLKLYKKRWYLIHPGLKYECSLSNTWDATLLEGVNARGDIFLMLWTLPLLGRNERYLSLKAAIDEARVRWTTLESVIEKDEWVIKPTRRSAESLEPIWFDGKFSQLVELAFKDRIIRTTKEAKNAFGCNSHRNVEEDPD